MANRPSEIAAASLLLSWTDADTAMQIVGTSLGVFGAGALDPTIVLATETPLRNALFDVLLSLVEGGALELRTTDGSRYAFRWRADIAVAGLASDDETIIDLAVPSPYLAELQQARTERDDALGRAEFAEALAAERERQLHLAGVRAQADPPPAHLSESQPREITHPDPTAWIEPPKREAAEKPVPRKAAAKPPVSKPAVPKAALPKTAAKKVAPKKAAAAAKKPAPRKAAATKAPPVDIDLTAEPDTAEPGRKWSGYAIEKTRKHLTSVDTTGAPTTREPGREHLADDA